MTARGHVPPLACHTSSSDTPTGHAGPDKPAQASSPSRNTRHKEGIMTTHAPARATDRPIPSPFTGAGKLWLSTFLSHILNPWNMAFALAVPLSCTRCSA